MDDQLSLFNSAPAAESFSLFLALQPDPETAGEIYRLANDMRTIRGLGGRLRPANHLHVSLYDFGSHAAIPSNLVSEIDRACANIAALTLPFDVTFDRLMRFQGSEAYVLSQESHPPSDLSRFHHVLGRTLALHAVKVRGSSRFTPHVTLQYTRVPVATETIAPISWHVDEIVLISSEGGATRYTHHGRWSLSGI